MWDYLSNNTWVWVLLIAMFTVVIGLIIYDNVISDKKKK